MRLRPVPRSAAPVVLRPPICGFWLFLLHAVAVRKPPPGAFLRRRYGGRRWCGAVPAEQRASCGSRCAGIRCAGGERQRVVRHAPRAAGRHGAPGPTGVQDGGFQVEFVLSCSWCWLRRDCDRSSSRSKNLHKLFNGPDKCCRLAGTGGSSCSSSSALQTGGFEPGQVQSPPIAA